MTAILRLQLDDKDPVRVNSAINQLAEYSDRNQRTRLTANTAFYVSTSGSDSNSGSQASPFLTIQHAYDVITNTFDLGGQSVTIQCASGTYTAGLSILQPWTGGGTVTLDLGGGTISNPAACIDVAALLPNNFVIRNGTLTSSGGICISHQGTGQLLLGAGLTFGPATIHMSSHGAGSKIRCINNYTITSGALWHYLAFDAGNAITGDALTVTLTGTPAFTNSFVLATRLGCIEITAFTFSGTATGQRYAVDTNGVIFTAGGGANYFPGTVPGTSGVTGGQYA